MVVGNSDNRANSVQLQLQLSTGTELGNNHNKISDSKMVYCVNNSRITNCA